MDIEARTLEEVLRDLDGALRDLYVERYRGLVLYGSQARGEADEGSDVDLLLLLEEPVEVGKEYPALLRGGGSPGPRSQPRAFLDTGGDRRVPGLSGPVPDQRPRRGRSRLARMSYDPETLDNLLAKARRSFEAAESLLKDDHADFAASRASYPHSAR